MAIIREIEATWKPSQSPDVIAQKLRWFINGRLIKQRWLKPGINEARWSIDNPRYPVHEGDSVVCQVCAVDDVKSVSEWIEATVTFPYSKPEPPKDMEIDYQPKHKDIV